MEVSRQNGSCGCQLRGLRDVGRLQRLLTPGRHQPSQPYGPVVKSPSRDAAGTGFSKAEDFNRSRTLEGVLRGQVPSIFTNLRRSTQSEDQGHAVKTKPLTSPTASPVSTVSPKPSTSPVTPYTLKRTYTQVEQEEPIDLSCKKMHSDMVVSSRLDGSDVQPTYPGRSPSPRPQLTLSGQKAPSLLRNLLCLGKDLDASRFMVNADNPVNSASGHPHHPGLPVHMESTFSEGLDHPRLANPSPPVGARPHGRFSSLSQQSEDSASKKNNNNTGTTGPTTKVTLAKKNMLPVSARVSDWLVKIIRFAKSIPEFMSLLHNDKLALILNSWARLLLLYMAENNFQFAVTPDLLDHSPPVQCPESPAHQENPTMKSVESVQCFIRKCQNMGTDSKEYAFLRMAVLFNAGIRGLDRPDMVDRVNSSVQQLLQQHVQASRPRDYMHYSRLLMSLPALYGINCKMIENLFCRHINGNMDMDVLLKEMLQNI